MSTIILTTVSLYRKELLAKTKQCTVLSQFEINKFRLRRQSLELNLHTSEFRELTLLTVNLQLNYWSKPTKLCLCSAILEAGFLGSI